MTTSTDKNLEKPIKKKGPFRVGLLIGLSIISIASFLYIKFLFDINLKRTLEWSLTHIHGAEVNISKLDTNFLDASLIIKKVEITNKEKPQQNQLQIDTITIKLLWDALLRGKIVINESSIDQISINTKRNHIGFIVPEDSKNILEENETIKEGKQQAINVIKEKFKQNALGDIATLLDGTDAKTYANDLKDELATQKKIKEIENLVHLKEKEWSTKVANLPKESEFKSIINKVKSTKIDKNPLKAAKQITDLTKTVKDAQNKVKVYTDAIKDLEKDIKLVESQYKSIDDVIKEDLKSLESRFNIPEIDAASLSLAFFSKMIGQNEQTLQKYLKLAQTYLPKKKSSSDKEKEKEKDIKPQKRGSGHDYTFSVTTGYPKFWLKKSIISSKASKNSGLSGNLSGILTNLSNDPQYIKKPALLKIEGNFPKENIQGLELQLQLNHHIVSQNETFSLFIKDYPIKGVKLSNSNKMEITMAKANSQLNLKGTNHQSGLKLNLRNDFRQAQFNVKSTSKKSKKIMEDILKDINTAYLSAKVNGPSSSLKWDISSNVGSQISYSLKNLLKKKIDKLKQNLNKSVQDKIKGSKSQLDSKISNFKNKHKSKINEQKSKAQRKIKELTQSLTQKTKEKSNKLLKDASKKLKKLFKF